ncbi:MULTISPECIES: CbiM family transporter [Anoxynatronum]|uniref:Cobalt/nickel transport system permease protein n=2 Tax=Anoxynatronum TaxID=210622 RepID=A0AA46AIM8_9CLOT|nr:CbiM family transporter [Anoxynatronum buryatiense]SMP51100.1 cobalt/nickel transport system permease protein [Anoxynatronum buryatiense]
MHLADGVLNAPTIAITYAGTAALVGYGLKQIQEEEIPKISLMTGTFFAVSLISIPVGPSSIHPLIAGLLGVMLGRRAPVALFIGLLLQAILFQHGGLTSLGANTLMLAIPALTARQVYLRLSLSPLVKGMVAGALATVLTVAILVLLLVTSQPLFARGAASVVNLLIIGHLPLVAIEAVVTGFALQLMARAKPQWLEEGGVA